MRVTKYEIALLFEFDREVKTGSTAGPTFELVSTRVQLGIIVLNLFRSILSLVTLSRAAQVQDNQMRNGSFHDI